MPEVFIIHDALSANPQKECFARLTTRIRSDNDGALLEVTMSFGFSIGDFIQAIDLANRVRKEFVDAPSQFKGISDE
jgi:hypothetical protein